MDGRAKRLGSAIFWLVIGVNLVFASATQEPHAKSQAAHPAFADVDVERMLDLYCGADEHDERAADVAINQAFIQENISFSGEEVDLVGKYAHVLGRC